MALSLRSLPAGMFGAVMGLAGLGLACRSAAELLPVPGLLAEFWSALGALALALLLPAYLLKILRHPDAVREEFGNPALIGFCATLPVGMTLAAACIEPYSAQLAQLLWWCGAPLLLILQLWTLARLARGRARLAHINGGWLIVLVGGIVMPFAGLPLGHEVLSTGMYCASAVAAPFVMTAIVYRAWAGPVLPEALRPSWFILLVPPSLIYVNGLALWPAWRGLPLEFLYYLALLLAAALFVVARRFWRWPFGAPWWAFTFPLDAVAAAALRYAGTHGGPWRAVAGAALLLANLAVALVLARTLTALARGRLLPQSAGNGP